MREIESGLKEKLICLIEPTALRMFVAFSSIKALLNVFTGKAASMVTIMSQ